MVRIHIYIDIRVCVTSLFELPFVFLNTRTKTMWKELRCETKRINIQMTPPSFFIRSTGSRFSDGTLVIDTRL